VAQERKKIPRLEFGDLLQHIDLAQCSAAKRFLTVVIQSENNAFLGEKCGAALVQAGDSRLS
jgi:hypothetical protein